MNRINFVLFLIISSANVFSQNSTLLDTIYFNHEIDSFYLDKENVTCHKYISIGQSFMVEECYFSNGNIFSRATFLFNKRNGLTQTWYANGQIKSIDNFIMGCHSGNSWAWYSNGFLKSTGSYWIEFNNSVIYLNQSSIDTIKTIDTVTLEDQFLIISTDCVEIKDGLWYYYNDNGELQYTENYIRGKLED